MKTKKKEALPIWEEMKKERAAITIGEFLSLMGWSPQKLSRMGNKIRFVEGFGNRMISVSAVSRILGESIAPRKGARREPKSAT